MCLGCQKYRVREHEAIFASADAEQVSHTSFAGDVNSGKAWKAVRRPSDMVRLMFVLSTEYTNGSRTSMLSRFKSIGLKKNQERHTVKSLLEASICSSFHPRSLTPFNPVLGVKGLKVPIPQQATALTCTLNNGIHFVTTPVTRLSPDARIDQEFELYVNSCIPSIPS